MKRLSVLFAALTLLLITTPCWALIRNIQDNYRLIYHIIDVSGAHVTAETVTLKIQKQSNGYWFDFDDSTFKVSGWTTKATQLSEDSTEGFYYYVYNPPASETAAEQYLFLINNSSYDYGDHQSLLVSYQDIGTSTFEYSSDQVIVATNNDKEGYSISGTKTTLDALNDIAAADVWSVESRSITGLTAAALADFFDTDSTTTYASAISGSVVKEIADNAAGGGLTVEDIVDAVWNEDQSEHITDGTFGYYLDGQVSAAGSSSLTAADVWDYETREITGGTIDTNNDKSEYTLSSAGIAAIWNELQAGYITPGTFGYFLDGQVSLAGSGTGITAADVWDYDISEYSSAGMAGTYLKGAAIAGDPWMIELPGSYIAGQAGYDLPALIKQSRGR